MIEDSRETPSALPQACDAWERIKYLGDTNKFESAQLILYRSASEPAFREVLEREARALTQIGNSHLLRHHERNQTPVIDVDHADYLYHRLFAMLELVIRRNAPR